MLAGMMQQCTGCCRKLGVHNFISDSDLPIPPTFDMSGLEAMTQLTELHITVPFVDKQQDLGNLTQLQRLTLDYVPIRPYLPHTTCLPFVCPAIASVTKLTFNIAQEVGSESMLIT